MIIYLIRHGDNESLGNYLPGRKPGVHLNENGRVQACNVGQSLLKANITDIISSPLERTMETAQPLADSLKLPIIQEPGLMEMDTGEFTGLPFSELNQQKEWESIRKQPEKTGFPGGERFDHAWVRVWNTIQRLHTNYPPQSIIAVISHSDCIKMILTGALQLPLAFFPRFMIEPASLSIIGFKKETTWVGGINFPLPYQLPPYHPQHQQGT